MKILTASLATEANTFSPLPITLDDFHASFYAAPSRRPDTPTLCSAPIAELRKLTRSDQEIIVDPVLPLHAAGVGGGVFQQVRTMK